MDSIAHDHFKRLQDSHIPLGSRKWVNEGWARNCAQHSVIQRECCVIMRVFIHVKRPEGWQISLFCDADSWMTHCLCLITLFSPLFFLSLAGRKLGEEECLTENNHSSSTFFSPQRVLVNCSEATVDIDWQQRLLLDTEEAWCLSDFFYLFIYFFKWIFSWRSLEDAGYWCDNFPLYLC